MSTAERHETRTILVCFTPEEKAEIETLAAHDDRIAAGFVRKIVREFLRGRKRQSDFPKPHRARAVP